MAEGGGDVTVSNSTTATLTLTSSIVGSFNESLSVVVFDDLDVWLDMDGDGFGDPAVPVDACDPANTLPYAFNDADCDDANANVYLDASPTGEGVDNNCDGVLSPDEMVPCPGDLNLDTQVSVADVLVMLSDFGCISACESDLTSDGSVGVEDFWRFWPISGRSADAGKILKATSAEIAVDGQDVQEVAHGDLAVPVHIGRAT